MVAQIGVGGLERVDAMQGELLDEAILQGAIEPLDATAGLRGVAGDVLDAQLLQGAADLGQAGAIDALPGPARVKGPRGPVGVQGHWQPGALAHYAQGAEHGLGALARPELGVQQALGRVVDHGDQGLPLIGAQRQPYVIAPIQVQQLAEARAGRAPAAVAAPGTALADQAGFLQGKPDEAIRQLHAMLAPSEAMKVAHVPAEVAFAIQAQDALHLRSRRLPR